MKLGQAAARHTGGRSGAEGRAVIYAYTGRRSPSLPKDGQERVTERPRRLFAQSEPEAVVGSAACGADLLVLETVLALHAQRGHPKVEVVLPTRPDVFREDSVEPGWRSRFDDVLAWVRETGVVHELGMAPGSEAYERANHDILGNAARLATEFGARVLGACDLPAGGGGRRRADGAGGRGARRARAAHRSARPLGQPELLHRDALRTRGPGADAPLCLGKRATIVGTPGRDVLNGTRRGDVIVALAGNDAINALSGNDVVCAGAGNDRVTGGLGADRIAAGAGNDRIAGGAGVDTLLGGAGLDTLLGGAGRDVLTGGPGRDQQTQ
jgi:RTX calcium-binding nonapeptide repeat (4 copies)